jgi:hypothetical protein
MKTFSTIFAALAVMTNSTVAAKHVDVRDTLKKVHLNAGKAARKGMSTINWDHKLPEFALKGNHECSKI